MKIQQPFTLHKHRGIALLLMLSLLIIVLTTVAITRLSLNDLAQKRQATTLSVLIEAREAVMAWTLTQNFSLSRSPGTLPCPDSDTTRDGRSNTLPGGLCVSRIGLVPFRDLGIPEPLDSYGNPIWYVVAAEYVGDRNTGRNSSLQSNLILEEENDLNPRRVAFIVMAPNGVIDNQVQQTRPVMASITNFLDGKNADADLNEFTDQTVPDNVAPDVLYNDTILAMSESNFWALVEERVFVDMKSLLAQYFSDCSSYPWAVPFAALNSNGQPNTYQGRLPVTNEWGMPCHAPQDAITAPVFQPQWLRDHWGSIFYYALCQDAVAVNPPTTSCLNLGNGMSAKIILIGPGSAMNGQNRAILNITNYLENENAAPVNNTFQKTARSNHTALFNDLINIVAP